MCVYENNGAATCKSSTYPCLPPSVCVSSLTLFVRSRRRWRYSHQSGSPPRAVCRTHTPHPGTPLVQRCGRRRKGGLSRASPVKSPGPPANTLCGCGGSPLEGGGGYAPPPGHTPRSWCSRTDVSRVLLVEPAVSRIRACKYCQFCGLLT